MLIDKDKNYWLARQRLISNSHQSYRHLSILLPSELWTLFCRHLLQRKSRLTHGWNGHFQYRYRSDTIVWTHPVDLWEQSMHLLQGHIQPQLKMNPHNDFRCVMMLAPEVSGGSSFAVSVNGNRSQDFSVSDGENQFSLK